MIYMRAVYLPLSRMHFGTNSHACRRAPPNTPLQQTNAPRIINAF
jgi:hypothetical protein